MSSVEARNALSKFVTNLATSRLTSTDLAEAFHHLGPADAVKVGRAIMRLQAKGYLGNTVVAPPPAKTH